MPVTIALAQLGQCLVRKGDILKNWRVVFNIKGNDYRLVAALAYNVGLVFVKFIGTHKAYEAIDAEIVEPE